MIEKLIIRENLLKSKIEFEMVDNEIVIWCPFCQKKDKIRGQEILTFHINQETGFGQCQTCSRRCNFDELTKKLGINNRSESNKNKEIESIPSTPRLWTITDILAADFGEEEWLVDKLIPLPSITALSGNPSNYKTWLTIVLAQSIAEGKPFLEQFPTQQGAVLIVDEEDHIRHIKKRLLQLNVFNWLPIFYLSQEDIKIDDNRKYKSLIKIIEEQKIKLLVLDSLVRIHGKEENDASQMALVMNQLKQFIKNGVSVLFTHHHRKQGLGLNNPSQSLRGSSDILAAVDCHLTVEKFKDNEKMIVISQEKLRTAQASAAFNVSIEKQDDKLNFKYAGLHDNKKTKTDEAREAILQLLTEEPQLRRGDIHERINTAGIAGKQAIDSALGVLEEKKAIELIPWEELPENDRKKHCYRLAQTPSQLPTNI